MSKYGELSFTEKKAIISLKQHDLYDIIDEGWEVSGFGSGEMSVHWPSPDRMRAKLEEIIEVMEA